MEILIVNYTATTYGSTIGYILCGQGVHMYAWACILTAKHVIDTIITVASYPQVCSCNIIIMI